MKDKSQHGIKPRRRSFLQVAIAILLFSANISLAQKDTTPKERLWSPATVKALIGARSYDSYVINARQGRTMTVQVSWQREGDNRAEFSVSKSPDFLNRAQGTFGKKSVDGRNWTGEIPKSGNYYIYVVGYPLAHCTFGVRYTLRLKVK